MLGIYYLVFTIFVEYVYINRYFDTKEGIKNAFIAVITANVIFILVEIPTIEPLFYNILDFKSIETDVLIIINTLVVLILQVFIFVKRWKEH